MFYLTRHETVAAYNAVKDNLDIPQVALIDETDEVKYQPFVEPTHDYVEIGGVKWATMNLGANSVTDGGLIFQWGDTQGYTAAQVGSGSGQKYFGYDDYKFYDNGSYTKYNSTDGKMVLDASDDAVNAAWGGNWRMMSLGDIETMEEAGNVDAYKTNDYQGSGVAGYVFVDTNDRSKEVFFPNAAIAFEGETVNACRYWMNSLDDQDISNANMINFSGTAVTGVAGRCFGFLVRGVLDE